MPELKESKSKYICRIYQNIPQELRAQDNWVVHEKKIPFDPKTKKAAKSNDKSTWGTFQQSIEAYASNGYQGIGFCFEPPFVGVDIDKSLDLTIPEKLQSYTEYSPSGNGLHVICTGTIPKAIRTKGLEIYTQQRFFTVTGKRLDKFPLKLANCTEALKAFYSSEAAGGEKNEPGWIAETLQAMTEGNMHNSQVKIFGKLRRDGWTKEDAKALVWPYIEKVNGNQEASEARLNSVWNSYEIKRQGMGHETQEELDRPVELFTPKSHLGEYEKDIEDRQTTRGAELATGFSKLDELTNGLKKGSIWVVGARTGIGKTSFSVNICASLLRLGKRVLFFSTEMDQNQILDRIIAVNTGIDLFSFGEQGFRSDEDRRRYGSFRRALEQSPLYICQEPEPTLRTVSRAISQSSPDAVIFDHIQRIGGADTQRYLELSRFVKGMNTLCRQHKVAGVINSQLNRLAELEPPALHHLKECGSLEEEAHCVILLSMIPKSDGMILVDVAKNRGRKGQLELKLNTKTCAFEEV